MKQNPQIIERAASVARPPHEPVRKPVLILAAIVLLLCVAGAILFANRDRSATPVDPAVSEQNQASGKAPATTEETPVETTGTAVSTTHAGPTQIAIRNSATAGSSESRPEPTPATRQLVTSLTQVDLSQGPLTPEKAANWKQNLQQLTAQGAAAVPAIREFLEKSLDQNFDNTTSNLLGQPSLRLSLMDALQNIGGPEAMGVSAQMLQTTLDPREIAWLAQSLEQQAPGQYSQMALDAVSEALKMASTGQLEGRDVGPLFGVLQKFGGDDATGELEKFASQYRYYATIALANLPEGAGISTLVSMVQDPEALSKGGRAPALQMLAEAAPENPQAMQALLDQAKLGQIPSSTWLNIGSMLCGDRMVIGTAPVESGIRSFHLASGNQNFYTIPDRSPWPASKVEEYMSVANRLAAVNNNPTAATALQNAIACLQARMQQPE